MAKNLTDSKFSAPVSLKVPTDKINAHTIYKHQETSQRKDLQANKEIIEKM